MLSELRERVWQANLELPKAGLVVMTSGNASARDPVTGLVVIKPSGVRYEALTPASMVVLDPNGAVVEGDLAPSVDAPSHLYVYRRRPDVGGVVHTHSPYATSFAALGRAIPVYLTAMADEFGGPIPTGPYAAIGGEEVGRAIVEHIGGSRAILLKNHGVFTIGASVEDAVRVAVAVENAAKIVHLALCLGLPDEIPEAEVARAHRRYVEAYGQGKRRAPGARGAG